MKTIFLTRRQYNALVEHYPRLMRDTYPNLERRWSFSGVRVSGAWTALANLECLAIKAEAAEEARYHRACAADRWDGQT